MYIFAYVSLLVQAVVVNCHVWVVYLASYFEAVKLSGIRCFFRGMAWSGFQRLGSGFWVQGTLCSTESHFRIYEMVYRVLDMLN